MASGNVLFKCFARDAVGPATVYAQQTTIAGASTPAEVVPVAAFDDTTVEYLDFYDIMPAHYAGGGLTISIKWGAAAATNNGIWSLAFRRVADDTVDLDTTAFTYDYNTTGDITPPSAVGEVAYDTVTFTNGADMDSLAVGEYFILRIKRPAPSGTKITGDMYFHALEVKET